jgi:ABC-type transport system involved in multi-copper enzyme maturation permease subunit
MTTLIERARRALRDPNPIVRKELLVLLRTPTYVRFIVGGLIALAIVVLGVALSATDHAVGPSRTTETGRALFQVFFGVTFVFIAVMGATFGAVTITQERENRTLDGLTLSALGPRRIVRGKLAAIFLAMAFVPVAMLPVLGVVFLFGGVSVAHLCIAAVYVLALGAVGIALGVAISARAATTRRALIATVPVVLAASLALGGALTGIGETVRRSTGLTLEGPFFFADAYLALRLDRAYVFGLMVVPVYFIGGSFWLAYAAARAGLMDPTEDRGLPIKRWTLAVLLAGVAVVRFGAEAFALRPRARLGLALVAQVLVVVLGIALIAAAAAEPLDRSARQRKRPPPMWSAIVFPPGLVPSMGFVVAVCGAAMLALPSVLLYDQSIADGEWRRGLGGACWAIAYLAALAGLVARVRVWRRRAGPGQIALTLALLSTWVLLFLAVSLTGGLDHDWQQNPVLAFSPVWAAIAVADNSSSAPDPLPMMFVAAFAYALVGAALLASAERARRVAVAAAAERNARLMGAAGDPPGAAPRWP